MPILVAADYSASRRAGGTRLTRQSPPPKLALQRGSARTDPISASESHRCDVPLWRKASLSGALPCQLKSQPHL